MQQPSAGAITSSAAQQPAVLQLIISVYYFHELMTQKAKLNNMTIFHLAAAFDEVDLPNTQKATNMYCTHCMVRLKDTEGCFLETHLNVPLFM